MTITEAKNELTILSETIEELIMKYEKDTDLIIESIQIGRFETINTNDIISVQITTKL